MTDLGFKFQQSVCVWEKEMILRAGMYTRVNPCTFHSRGPDLKILYKNGKIQMKLNKEWKEKRFDCYMTHHIYWTIQLLRVKSLLGTGLNVA